MSLMNGIDSVGYFPNGFWQRWLMPLVGPLQELVLFVAIPLVGAVDNLVVASFALHQVLVPKPAPPRLQCTFELYPFARELISVHGVFLLCEWRCLGADEPAQSALHLNGTPRMRELVL